MVLIHINKLECVKKFKRVNEFGCSLIGPLFYYFSEEKEMIGVGDLKNGENLKWALQRMESNFNKE